MVDVVHLAFVVAQGQHVLHRVEEVFRAQRHLVLVDGLAELAVESEPADSPETIPIGIEEFLGEERLRLFLIRRVARPKPHVELEQGLLVAWAVVLRQGVHDDRITNVLDDLDLLDVALLDDGELLPDLAAGVDEDLAGGGVHNRTDRPHGRGQLAGRHHPGREEQPKDRIGRPILGIHGPQEHGGGNLAGLVDLDYQDVLLGDADLDPASPLGDDPAAVKHTVAFLALDQEVHAGAAVQLADDDADGAVDDELTAADHHGDFAQVDRLFRQVRAALRPQPAMDFQRIRVRQTKLPTLEGRVMRFFELIADVLQGHLLVVTLDGEDLPEQRFETRIGPLRGRNVFLQELGVAVPLDRDEIGDLHRILHFAETTKGPHNHLTLLWYW